VEDFRLKVFRIAAERLNFTQAAERLHLTQPAVTLQIKNLEQDLRTRLFDRVGGKVRLTAAGEVLLDYSRRIEQLYEEARRSIGEATQDVRGTLALGVSTTISQYVLPHVLAHFSRAHPGVKVSVLSGNTEKIVEMLCDGRIELSMIEGPPGRTGIRLEKFLEDEIVLIVPREHEWSDRHEALDPSKLQSVPLLFREKGSGTRDVVESALKSSGLDVAALQIVMELDSTEAIKAAVEAGLGAGLVSRWALRSGPNDALAVVPLSGLRILRAFNFAYLQGPDLEGLPGLFLRAASALGGRFAAGAAGTMER